MPFRRDPKACMTYQSGSFLEGLYDLPIWLVFRRIISLRAPALPRILSSKRALISALRLICFDIRLPWREGSWRRQCERRKKRRKRRRRGREEEEEGEEKRRKKRREEEEEEEPVITVRAERVVRFARSSAVRSV